MNIRKLCLEIENKKKQFKTQVIIIYGSGKDGKNLKKILSGNNDSSTFLFCDTDSQKSGDIIDNIPIISLEELTEAYRNSIVVVASRRYQTEIYSTLIKVGFENERILFPTYDKDENEYGYYKKCICCNRKVKYNSLPHFFNEMAKEHGWVNETLNIKEYGCPLCGSADRDRLIVAFMDKIGLAKSSKEKSFLQFAPNKAIENWIYRECKGMIYHSTDLYMENVTFVSDIQDMQSVENEKYDYFICSHVLEHVKNDKKAMAELYRILKPKGIGIFLVPIDLNAQSIDEEWGLSEEENWLRFGQGDHCRRYAKQELLERLKEAGFIVNELGKEYFGNEIFKQSALTDTSTLYILTKQRNIFNIEN